MQAALQSTQLREFLTDIAYPLTAEELVVRARQGMVRRRWQQLMAMLKPDLMLYGANEAAAEIEALDILESQKYEVTQEPFEFEED